MDAMEALLGRQSTAPAFLDSPAPDGDALARILQAAVAVPDHAKLRPWRFHLIRGAARERLGEVFAEALRKRDPAADEQAFKIERARPLRAPLLIAVTTEPVEDKPNVPPVEQILSAGFAMENILLAAHALGYGAILLTGANAYDDHVKRAFGLSPKGVIGGFVYLGSRKPGAPAKERPDPATVTQEWTGA